MSHHPAACGPPDPGLDTPVSEPPKKRRRPALACVQCRRRKTRCDQNKPCNNCTKSRIVDCTYPPTHSPRSQVNRLATPRRQAPSLAPRAAEPIANQSPPSPNSLLRHGLQYDAPHVVPAQEARSASSVTPSPAVNASEMSLQRCVGKTDVDALLTRINELENTVSDLSSAHAHRIGNSAAAQKSTSPARKGTSGHQFGNQSNWMSHTSLVSLDSTA